MDREGGAGSFDFGVSQGGPVGIVRQVLMLRARAGKECVPVFPPRADVQMSLQGHSRGTGEDCFKLPEGREGVILVL